MKRVRLDSELVEQGFCTTADEALRLVLEGRVSSAGERFSSAAALVSPGVPLHVKGSSTGYVGRGGVKLAGALDALHVDVAGRACLDIGCSTGGFSDCLLKRGAASVLAVDVGSAQFDWRLRCDPRVRLLEKTNITSVPALGFRACCSLAVCDVSFTGIARVLPAALEVLEAEALFLALVKPQFEAPAEEVGAGGVVTDPAVHRRVLERVIATCALSAGLDPVGACPSPITGAKGNREFFLLARRGKVEPWTPRALEERTERLVGEAVLP